MSYDFPSIDDGGPIGGPEPSDASAPLRAAKFAPVSPRAARIGRLAVDLAAAYAEGDVEGALVLHQAIGRFLAAPSEGSAPVVDLARERERRGR